MKAELVKKTDEFIAMLLKKPEITVEEYMILDKKLWEIKSAEEEEAHNLEMAESEKRLKAMMNIVFPHAGEGDINDLH